MDTVELTYRQALSLAVAEEMRRDPSVLVMGEDIGASGGPLKTTEGLFEEFGPARVRDTPISENAFVGAALGLALCGYRPIVEIMFADFLGVCYDQIVNAIAKHRFMSGGRMDVPLVIRVIGGGGLRFGAQHSQTGETWLLPIPGLKIVAASTPEQAYGMLKSAIRDPDPVVFIEHKALLGTKGQVHVGPDNLLPLKGTNLVAEGDRATVVASLAMVPKALEAAEILAGEGIEIDVFDLRALRPMQTGDIVESVKRTAHLLTVEEISLVGGWGAEVVAQTVAEAFDYLDAPPMRLGLPEHPLPYSPPLEDAAIPDAERIAAAVRDLLA
ncbi:MAG: alpha-ketoacid dehydrogenase subunit beta [Azospirillaceae bacterium]